MCSRASETVPILSVLQALFADLYYGKPPVEPVTEREAGLGLNRHLS